MQKFRLCETVQFGEKPAGQAGKNAGNNKIDQLVAPDVDADKFSSFQILTGEP